MAITRGEHHGLPVVRIEAGSLTALATTSLGPRILGLLAEDGRDLMAQLPDATLECPGSGVYRLLGGHRLWVAPEVPELTYRPDEDPVSVSASPDGVTLTGATDPVAGIQRSLTIESPGERRVRVRHVIANRSDAVLRQAPWAITLVPHGGRAFLPLSAGPLDDGFQAERNIVLWPYTRLDDPRLAVSDRLLEVRTDGRLRSVDDRLKVGTSMRRGWIAWWGDGALFVKRARHDEAGAYADLGASGQLFANAYSIELETLGPLVDLAPGATVEHVEDWEVHLVDEATAEAMVRDGALDEPLGG
jgi:hypothetical protein